MSARKPLRFSPTYLSLALSLCLIHPTSWADSIRKVTLSTAGLADIVRQLDLPEKGPLSFTVPLDQVNDVLKTLMVTDGKNQISSITLTGLAPLDSSFSGMPFNAESLSSIATLAEHLRGVRVRANSNGRSLEGKVLGVETQHNGQTSETVLSLLVNEGEVHTLRLAADSSLQVLDPKVQAQLQQASVILAQQTNDNQRAINVNLEQPQGSVVELNYLIAAPVWKTTYRLLIEKEKTRLQAWAVLENTTGQDWNQIQLSLNSGAPVLFQQALLQQYWHDRPYLPIAVGSSEAPEADRQQVMFDSAMAPAPAMAAGAAYQERQQKAMAARSKSIVRNYEAPSLATALSQESQTQVQFTIADPVTVPQGQTVSVPIIDSSLQAERVSVYQQGQSSSHPTAAIYLNNTLDSSLPPGIMTVFDAQTGHVGDAELAGLPTGESRLIYFAQNNKIHIRQEQQERHEILHTKVSDGVAKTAWQQSIDLRFDIKGAQDQASVVVLELPRRSGWEFSSDAKVETTQQSYRLRVPVPAGATKQVLATFSRTEAQSLRLDDIDDNTLQAWSQAKLNDELSKALPELLRLHAQVQAAHAVYTQAQTQLEEASAEQLRIRENLTAVSEQSNLGQRFTEQLASQEDLILAARQELQQARKTWQSARAQFQQALAAL